MRKSAMSAGDRSTRVPASPLMSARTGEALAFVGAAVPVPDTVVPLVATFDGGRLTSDGGLPWLSEAEAVVGVCAALAAVVPEWRQRPGRHPLAQLVRQRVFQIGCGYADQNDATTLRTDPLLKLVCGRLPETGDALASQPTLSRLDNAPNGAACYRLALALLEVYLCARERTGLRGAGGRPRRVLLDLDGTDDPTHGDQEGSAYHGYYGQHMYFPLLVFDGDTNQLVTAVLRPGNAHGSRGVVAVLKRLVPRLRTRWPGVRIELRADSGFAVPALYDYCDTEGIGYTIGLIPNPRLEAVAAPLLVEAQRRQAAAVATGVTDASTASTDASTASTVNKVRLAGETTYQAGTWATPRRVVYKAEALAKGPNTRFVVTTRKEPPLAVYNWYVDRGAPELWIKDFKRACFGDRLSCHRFSANQFRLLLHAAAYWLLDTLRRWLVRTGLPPLQLDTLRLRLLKLGGLVRETWTHHLRPVTLRVQLHLATSHPAEPLWHRLDSSRDRS